jgi:hypothetical protein
VTSPLNTNRRILSALMRACWAESGNASSVSIAILLQDLAGWQLRLIMVHKIRLDAL